MKFCPRRPWPLGQPAQWPLLLAVLIFFLFALPSFVKEPNTKPSRYKNPEINKRSSELQVATSRGPPTGTGPSTHAESAQEKLLVNTALAAKGLSTRGAREASPGEQNRAPPTTKMRAPKGQAKEEPTLKTLPPSPDQRKPTDRAATPSLQRTRGDMGQRRPPAAPQAVSQEQGDRAVSMAKMPAPAGQDGGRAPSTQARGLHLSTSSSPGATTAAVHRPSAGIHTKSKAKSTVRLKGPQAQGSTPSPSPSVQAIPELKASNFKSEPRWHFEENYSLEVGGLQTTCPDSLKVKAARSPWLQPLFLPNLTLFLDSGRFSRAEWERLEHFAPPFGFMELNYSLVQEVVTRFPPVHQQQLLLASLPVGSSRCISCAVVGNGGILNDSKVGRDIDAHDYVFRLSGAVIKGYEEDVGTRTSFYGFTAFSLTQSLYLLGTRGFQNVPVDQNIHYLHFLEGTRDFQWLAALLRNQTLKEKNLFWFRRRPQEAFREALQLDRYLLLHPDLLRYMKNRFLRSKTLDTAHWRIYRPTTGALLLLTALQLCDRVSAYGFITSDHKRFSDHYYDKSWKPLVFYINHDFKLEQALWKRLHDEGIIRLYQRPAPARRGP